MLLHPGGGRPLPEPTWLTRPFWDAAAEGRLVVQRCRACGAYVFRPEAACRECLSEDLEWVPSSGRGTVHSYSIVERPAFPTMAVPYVVATIEMDEGWYLMTNIVGCEETEVTNGMPVQVRFVDVDGIHLPFFEPRG